MKRVFVLASITAIIVSVTPIMAHDANHPELNDWYMGLQSKGKSPCCDGSEAIHLRDVDWESQNKENSHFRVRIPATNLENSPLEWVDVPDDALVEGPNKDGSTLVWPIYGYMGVSVRCFMPGALT